MHDLSSEPHDPQLLPGETSDSLRPDDVRHWVTVYADLIKMVETARAGSDDDPAPPDGRYAPGPCCPQWLRRRLDFWTRRLEQCHEEHPFRRST